MPDERSQSNKGFPVNLVTAPLIADLFLLAIRAIGKREVHDGTLGANDILPYNIMIFFLTLAYIAISIDCSGLIRLLALKVLKKGGKKGRLLFLLLYIFFFVLGSFIGNDPIILSGTAFLAYLTRVSNNITHPRAWIHTQFAVANIASAILVSSNPTNLVLAGAFGIKFITYTANMVVPVFITFIVLFPFLLFVIFKKEKHIPRKIEGAWLLKEQTDKKPVDPNIPDSRELAEGEDDPEADEVLNPFINRKSAMFGAFVMSATLITLLVVNASDQKKGGKETPVFYITLPAAFMMFCWDLGSGWLNREDNRKIAKEALEKKKARVRRERAGVQSSFLILPLKDERLQNGQRATTENEAQGSARPDSSEAQQITRTGVGKKDEEEGSESIRISADILRENDSRKPILVRFISRAKFAQWRLRATFPTVTAVLSLLPYKLLPFAFSMFVLVQGLVAQGWVAVFAYGWDYVCGFTNLFSPCSESSKFIGQFLFQYTLEAGWLGQSC
jgi:Na+/H+ antiporter NhaD/arsenite permease-like protein